MKGVCKQAQGEVDVSSARTILPATFMPTVMSSNLRVISFLGFFTAEAREVRTRGAAPPAADCCTASGSASVVAARTVRLVRWTRARAAALHGLVALMATNKKPHGHDAGLRKMAHRSAPARLLALALRKRGGTTCAAGSWGKPPACAKSSAGRLEPRLGRPQLVISRHRSACPSPRLRNVDVWTLFVVQIVPLVRWVSPWWGDCNHAAARAPWCFTRNTTHDSSAARRPSTAASAAACAAAPRPAPSSRSRSSAAAATLQVRSEPLRCTRRRAARRPFTWVISVSACAAAAAASVVGMRPPPPGGRGRRAGACRPDVSVLVPPAAEEAQARQRVVVLYCAPVRV